METNFLITEIKRVVLVDKYEYNEKFTSFGKNLAHNELIFHFTGNSKVYFGDNVFDIVPNTIRFLPKGCTSRYDVERQEYGACIFVAFDTDRKISENAFIIHNPYTQKLGQLFKRMFSTWVSKNDGYYFECISILYKIFTEIQKKDYIPESQYNAIKPAIEYIEKHFLDKKIAAEDLCSCCNISYNYIKKLFIKKFGVPPIKYSIQLKINYACDLLQSGDYTISQIARNCGYNDIYFFSRQFKEYVGLSPTEFVKKYKSSK